MLTRRIKLCFIFAVWSVAEALVEKLDKLNLRCDINNSKYWDLIDWYFERTSYVIATTITESPREKRDISTVFLMQLTKCECNNLLCYISRFNYHINFSKTRSLPVQS